MQEKLTNIERNSGALKFDLSTAVLQTNIMGTAILRDEPGNLDLKRMEADRRGRIDG
jgi:signal transduction histidine kinase